MEYTNDQSITLESTRAAFDQWRLSKSAKSEKIPDYLWDMVKSLTRHSNACKIRKFLGITREQFYRHVLNHADIELSAIAANDFIQVPRSQRAPESSECYLTIQHRDGHQMTIQSPQTFASDAIRVFISGVV